MIVDAHHHLWHLGGGYDWLDAPELAPIRRTFGPGDLRAELAAAGVTHTVLVEGGRCDPDEAALLLGHTRDTPEIAGVVAWDDPAAPVFPAYRDLPGAEHLVGLRAQVQAEDAGYLDRADVRAGLRRIGAAGLVFDLVIRADQLPSAARVAAALPDVRFVLDHLGKPRIRAGDLAPWRAAIAALAARPNVAAKLSGLVTEADWEHWKPQDLQPYAEQALDLFGPARLMFGSDWPVCRLAAPYGRVLAVADELITPLTSPAERAQVFGGTAAEIYRLDVGAAGVESPRRDPWH
ncbi:amidohydrolase family protein [Dactylosporangium sp. NPDC051484]|uniref:amidohydrolase family protein n=1 Tax=Dactylosporangium sp. NPDC051484 TaxID=3154942 RepID=UPI00344B34B1